MYNWNTIDELRNIFIDDYINAKISSKLEKACSEEYELMRDYNGRQLLELLQNVDDAYIECKPFKKDTIEDVEVNISYKNNILEVGNTGTVFTKETIERLCLGRASNKSQLNIGNKGTGFRSLLNDAEWIELYSNEFSIRFSEKFTKTCFQEYSKHDLVMRLMNTWSKDYPLCFPIMNCPEQINRIKHDCDTLIRIKLKEGNKKKDTGIAKQLEQPFYKSLLFLPNITKISIDTNNKCKTLKKIIYDDSVKIEHTTNNEELIIEDYYLFNKTAKIKKKEAYITIAVPKDDKYDFSNEKLYCYFPIRGFTTPIHAIIHAPFITNNSRDDVPNDNEEINKCIFSEVLLFIKTSVERLAKPEFGDLAIRTATQLSKSKLWASDMFNFEDEYLTLMTNAKILPTVNNEYISIKDKPKLFINSFPEEFSGEAFKFLLQLLETEENDEFVKKLANASKYNNLIYACDDLRKAINKTSIKWSVDVHIKVFMWWNNTNYKYESTIPKLLRDTKGRWIHDVSEGKVFLPTDGGISTLPDELSWVKLCVLRNDYVNILIKQLKETMINEWLDISNQYKAEQTGDKRILAAFSNKYLAVEFTELSSNDLIIRVINSQIDDYMKSKTFINWFFENFKGRLDPNSVLASLDFNLPDEERQIRPKYELFLNESYNNRLGRKLFENTSFKPLIDIDQLYEGDEIEEFILFINACGVLRFPQIIYSSFTPYSPFYSYVINKYSIELSQHSIVNVNYLESLDIDNFDCLISSMETDDIVLWLKQDENLRDLLLTTRTESVASQRRNSMKIQFSSNEYINYVLNSTPWIEIDGNKYAPSKIVKYEKLKSKVSGLYGISEHDLLGVVNQDIINILDFKDSMALLADSDIYRILTALSSFDNGEVSRKIYTDIIKYKRDKKPEYDAKDIFVLAKDGLFYPSDEVKYADRKLPKANLSKMHFIWIHEKQNSTTILEWLGVKRYESKLELSNYIVADYYLDDFTKEINDMKVVVLSIIDGNKTNVDKLKKLQIIPCIELVAKDIEQNIDVMHLEDYFYVEDGRNYYIQLPKDSLSFSHQKQSTAYVEAIADIFKQLLTLELNTHFIELLASKDSNGKRDRISEEYGIDKWNESYSLLYDENITNKLVIEFFSVNLSNEDVMAQVRDLDFTFILNDNDCETVINALRTINKDVGDLNDLSELVNINLRDYWQRMFRKFLDDNRFDYYNKTYSNLLTCDESMQNQYLQMKNDYDFYELPIDLITNTIHFNINETASKEFPIMTDYIDIIDAEIAYKRNYELLNPMNLYADEIVNSVDAKLMIYFQRESAFNNWVSKLERAALEEKKNDSNNLYEHLYGIIPKKENIVYREHEGTKEQKKQKAGTFTKSGEEKRNRAKKVLGNKGEYVIYNLLCDTYGKDNVFPISEAFLEFGDLKPGQVSSGDYDISYKDETGEEFFVEVKTGKSNSFILSKGELDFAKSKPDKFKLFVVYDIDSENPKYHELPQAFWKESEKFRLTPIIEKIEVDF